MVRQNNVRYAPQLMPKLFSSVNQWPKNQEYQSKGCVPIPAQAGQFRRHPPHHSKSGASISYQTGASTSNQSGGSQLIQGVYCRKDRSSKTRDGPVRVMFLSWHLHVRWWVLNKTSEQKSRGNSWQKPPTTNNTLHHQEEPANPNESIGLPAGIHVAH